MALSGRVEATSSCCFAPSHNSDSVLFLLADGLGQLPLKVLLQHCCIEAGSYLGPGTKDLHCTWKEGEEEEEGEERREERVEEEEEEKEGMGGGGKMEKRGRRERRLNPNLQFTVNPLDVVVPVSVLAGPESVPVSPVTVGMERGVV